MEVTKNEISKATIKNDRCNVIFKENTATDINTVNKDCSGIIHADLLASFNRMKVHLVMLCEQPEMSLISHATISDFDISQLDNYVITGYVIGGTDEHEGVTIIGQKLLKSGKVLNLIAPFTKYEDDYEFSEELGQDVQMCSYEVDQYLFHDKFGIKQQEFEFDKANEATIELSNAASGINGNLIIKGHGKRKKKLEELETVLEGSGLVLEPVI
jgi:hypothetical protein